MYTAPADIDLATHLARVPFCAHLGLYADETSALCHWHIPEAHELESWGDVRTYDGTVSLLQPLIAPLYNGKSAYELLAVLLEQSERSGRDIGGSAPEIHALLNRMFGAYAPLFWATLTCNVLVPQVLWSRRARANVPLLFVIALLVNIGMWLERFLIVVTGLYRNYLPSAWGMYYPNFLGLGHVSWHHRAVCRPAVAVCPFSPDDFDF